ncbi:MAG: TRIC cation channel family protein [Actinomycetes bacterium]|jgi:uncharacterized membrane protein YeiH
MSTPVVDVIAFPAFITITTVTFGGLSGALHATKRGLDPIGVFTISLLCAVGGGIIRDVLLQSGVPTFLVNPQFLGLAAVAAVTGFFLAGLVKLVVPLITVVDTLLIGSWVLLGAERALAYHLGSSAAILLGVITATGGGLIRDLLCGEVPAMVKPGEWYGLITIIAALFFVGLVRLGLPIGVAEASTMVMAAVLRIAAMRGNWHTPTAYDLWGDLESRMTAGVEQSIRKRDETLKQNEQVLNDASRD